MNNQPSSPDHTPPASQFPIMLRTAEEVSLSASTAGLTKTAGPVQLLHFSSQLNMEDIRLMEIQEPILSALRSGEK